MSNNMETGSSMIEESHRASTVPQQTPIRELLSNLDETTWIGTPLTYHGRDEYEAFLTNDVTIRKNSFVYIHGESGQHHLAYIKNMYDQNGEKLMKIMWFWKQDELTDQKILQQIEVEHNEIFIERAMDVVSVCCVECTVTILTSEDWEKLPIRNSEAVSDAYICCRELKGNKLLNYDISELQGYYLQDVFKYLDDQ
uniref:BAH domain-containing protein n=1 Tax=Kalanchoe fedtschenkoi TaxID=63787 RepID=A0A7N1A0L6_KALFE